MSNARKLADNLPSVGQLFGRNMVINGAMNISQRHGTSSVQLSATEQYLTDRFFNDTGSSFNLTADAVQSSDAPSGFNNSLRISCDAVTTPTSAQNGCITTIIEGQDCQRLAYGTSDAKDVTLSFYARSGASNSGHTYGVMLGAYLNGTRNNQVKSFTVTDSWQRFTITFNGTGTVTGTTKINDDTNPGMQISFSLAAGSDDQVNFSTWTANTGLKGFTGQDNFFDNTSNKFYLTGVQLEEGSQATPFEHRPFGDELVRCQRYYQVIAEGGSNAPIGPACYYNSSQVNVVIELSTPMRIPPSIDVVSGSSYYRIYRSGSNEQVDDFEIDQSSTTRVDIRNNTDASGTAGHAGMARIMNSAGKLAFTAEF